LYLCRREQQLCWLKGETDVAVERHQLAACARSVVTDSGFDLNHVRGGLCFLCALLYAKNGDEGMHMLGEELGEQLGYVPFMGIVGGPEFGMVSGKAASAALSTSLVVFSSHGE